MCRICELKEALGTKGKDGKLDVLQDIIRKAQREEDVKRKLLSLWCIGPRDVHEFLIEVSGEEERDRLEGKLGAMWRQLIEEAPDMTEGSFKAAVKKFKGKILASTQKYALEMIHEEGTFINELDDFIASMGAETVPEGEYRVSYSRLTPKGMVVLKQELRKELKVDEVWEAIDSDERLKKGCDGWTIVTKRKKGGRKEPNVRESMVIEEVLKMQKGGSNRPEFKDLLIAVDGKIHSVKTGQSWNEGMVC